MGSRIEALIRALGEMVLCAEYMPRQETVCLLEGCIGDAFAGAGNGNVTVFQPFFQEEAACCAEEVPGDGKFRRRTQEITAAFLKQLPQIRALVCSDLRAAYDGDPAAKSVTEILAAYPGPFAIMVHRLAHGLLKLGVPILPRCMAEYAHSRTGIDIHPGAVIGEGFFIDHGTGVVIGETAVIGRNVKLYQGVTLGALSTRDAARLRGTRRHPTIEDEVTIYAGATILGGGTVIGRGCVIGGNVFLTDSVPPGCRVQIKTPELTFRERKEES